MDFDAPEGWIISTLGKVVESQKGKVPKNFSDKASEGYVPYIDIEAFETGRVKRYATTDRTTISTDKDVLIVWDGARFGLSGKFSGGALGSTLVRLRSDYLERDYLLHFVRFHYKTINSRPRGTGTPHVEPDLFWTLQIGVPPEREQTRIAEKIETLFARLGKGEEALRDVQKLLARYRQSVLKSAFSGRLTADWRAENSHRLQQEQDLLPQIMRSRRAAWEGRGKYQEPPMPQTSELPRLPAKWVWASFDQLFHVFGGATPSRRVQENWDGNIHWVSSGEVAFCRITDTNEKITETGYLSCSTKIHPAGTVLLAMIGEGKTRGQAAILDIAACNNQNAAAIRVSESGIAPEYVYYFLLGNYEESRRKGQGGNQPALNGEKVKNFIIPLSSCFDEIREIVWRVDQAFSNAEAVEQWCKTELIRSAALRQSILKDAFAGRLVPQDPADEPAAAFVTRIRTNCALAPKPKRKRTVA